MMSDDFLPVYDLSMKTISPLHIGSGDRLIPVQWRRTRAGQLRILDLDRLINDVITEGTERQANELTSALERGTTMTGEMLGGRAIDDYTLYEIPCDWTSEANPAEVRTFVKQGGYGSYLPASSLKGALRSALLRGALLSRPEFFNRFESKLIHDLQDSSQKVATQSQALEAGCFVLENSIRGKRPNFDINRMIVVRDRSFDLSFLRAAQAEILTLTTHRQLTPKTTSVFLEVLDQGVRVSSQIIWQAQLLRDVANQCLHFRDLMHLIAYLPQYCRSSALYLIDQEIQFYSQAGQIQLQGWYETLHQRVTQLPENCFILPLGYGSGFDAKTITDRFSPEHFEIVCEKFRYTQGLGRPGNNRGNQWMGPQFTPKSRKVVVAKDGYLPLGWVEFCLTPAQGQPDWLGDWQKRLPAPSFWQPQPKSPNSVQQAANQTKATAQRQPVQPETGSSTLSTPVKGKFASFQVFHEPPRQGERFLGKVIYQEGSRTYLEIPELSPDDTAMAVLAEENHPQRRLKEGAKLPCEVIDVKADPKQKNFWLVYCREIAP